MDQALHCHKLDVQGPLPTRLLDRSYLPLNPNKVDMEDTQATCNNKDSMDFTAAKLEVMVVLVVQEVTKQLDKVTKAANMEATKALEEITMVIASNSVVDGVAITGINCIAIRPLVVVNPQS